MLSTDYASQRLCCFLTNWIYLLDCITSLQVSFCIFCIAKYLKDTTTEDNTRICNENCVSFEYLAFFSTLLFLCVIQSQTITILFGSIRFSAIGLGKRCQFHKILLIHSFIHLYHILRNLHTFQGAYIDEVPDDGENCTELMVIFSKQNALIA